MRKVSPAALAAALAIGTVGLVAAPAVAQKKNEKAATPNFKLSKGVRDNIGKAQQAAAKQDWAAANAAIAAAEPLATTPDDRYVIGVQKISVANSQQDMTGVASGIDMVIASGSAPAADLPSLYRNQGALAVQAKNSAKAEEAFTKLAELQPTSENLVSLAEMKYQNKKPQEALTALDKAVAAQKATGAAVDENWYKRGLAIAYDGKLKPETLKWSTAYVQAYPSATAWRNALQIYRADNALDDGQTLDLFRLARAAKALQGERDYFDYANTAVERGLPGEAEAVINEGFASNMVDRASKPLNDVKAVSTPRIAADKASLPASEKSAVAAANGRAALSTGDAYLSYGNYAKAAEMFKLALTKGGVDAPTAQTRLGIALARQGNKAEALQAFGQVSGPRKPLADFWAAWLNQQA